MLGQNAGDALENLAHFIQTASLDPIIVFQQPSSELETLNRKENLLDFALLLYSSFIGAACIFNDDCG